MFVLVGFGEGDRSMREDREDREAYRRGPMEGRKDTHCGFPISSPIWDCQQLCRTVQMSLPGRKGPRNSVDTAHNSADFGENSAMIYTSRNRV